MKSCWVFAVLLAVPATALLANPKKAEAKLSPANPKDIPTNLIMSGGCGKKVNRTKESVDSILSTYLKNTGVAAAKKVSLLKQSPPGPTAGGDAAEIAADLEAMEQHKDGYFYVGCVGDSMMTNADMHGDQGSKRYAGLGNSIAWYHDFTPKEDRVAISAEVCFDFCSTIKDMGYFGLTRGRECYCTPYYKRAGDAATGNCDTPCEGYMSEMCGNLAGRASMYQMHSCANAK